MSFTTATFARLEKNADGTATMIFRYTGNAGETPVERGVPVNSAIMPSADWSRSIAMEHLAILNTNQSFYAGALSAVGTVLDTTTPLPTPTALINASYMAASAPFTPGASPQDVFSITGSATRAVRVLGIGLSTIQTTAGMNAWSLVKRSTANSGGTSVAVAAVPTDKTQPGASATVLQYTGNPTAGTLVGGIWNGRIPSPVAASAVVIPHVWINLERMTVLLSGVGDVLAWNFGGAALPPGLSVQACVWWTENT